MSRGCGRNVFQWTEKKPVIRAGRGRSPGGKRLRHGQLPHRTFRIGERPDPQPRIPEPDRSAVGRGIIRERRENARLVLIGNFGESVEKMRRFRSREL